MRWWSWPRNRDGVTQNQHIDNSDTDHNFQVIFYHFILEEQWKKWLPSILFEGIVMVMERPIQFQWCIHFIRLHLLIQALWWIFKSWSNKIHYKVWGHVWPHCGLDPIVLTYQNDVESILIDALDCAAWSCKIQQWCRGWIQSPKLSRWKTKFLEVKPASFSAFWTQRFQPGLYNAYIKIILSFNSFQFCNLFVIFQSLKRDIIHWAKLLPKFASYWLPCTLCTQKSGKADLKLRVLLVHDWLVANQGWCVHMVYMVEFDFNKTPCGLWQFVCSHHGMICYLMFMEHPPDLRISWS